MNPFANIADAAAASTPMVERIHPGRVHLFDGDALAYACAGNADCSSGQARVNLVSRLRNRMALSGAESSRILLTSRASHKGHRYAIARVKPYQGQRSGGNRPKQWEFLRTLLESGGAGDAYPVEATATAEADDLFGKYSNKLGAANVVIDTQDKDMQMVHGWHCDWDTGNMTWVPPGTWALPHRKPHHVYGRKWFWWQMLRGDAADNVPGLPKYVRPDKKQVLLGEVTATAVLDGADNDAEAAARVFDLYRRFYADGWELHLLEQAALLWMRTDDRSSALDVLATGNPLGGCIGATKEWDAAVDAIKLRIAEAQV